MNDITEIVREAAADRGIRNVYEPFTRYQLSDTELEAAAWAATKFHSTFMGWELFRRIRAGMSIFHDDLDAWVIGGARLLARCTSVRSGQSYIAPTKRGAWIDQAARDALATVVRLDAREGFSSFVLHSMNERAREFNINPRTWAKIYKPCTAMLWVGFENFQQIALYEYRQARLHAPDFGCNVTSGKEPLDYSRLWYGPQVGNAWAPKRASGSD